MPPRVIILRVLIQNLRQKRELGGGVSERSDARAAVEPDLWSEWVQGRFQGGNCFGVGVISWLSASRHTCKPVRAVGAGRARGVSERSDARAAVEQDLRARFRGDTRAREISDTLREKRVPRGGKGRSAERFRAQRRASAGGTRPVHVGAGGS